MRITRISSRNDTAARVLWDAARQVFRLPDVEYLTWETLKDWCDANPPVRIRPFGGPDVRASFEARTVGEGEGEVEWVMTDVTFITPTRARTIWVRVGPLGGIENVVLDAGEYGSETAFGAVLDAFRSEWETYYSHFGSAEANLEIDYAYAEAKS